MTAPWKRAAVSSGIAGLIWAALFRLGRTWGATRQERDRYLHGDELIDQPRLVTNHAATIHASAKDVWPWLVQVGWHRAGWYTYRWVDRLLFPANPGSAESILPEHQDLKVGDRIPDGPPEADCFYVVEILERNKMMVLWSWTHMPKEMRKNPRNRMEWTWAFYLDEISDSETRFQFRVRGNLEPRWLRVMYRLLIVPADFIMGRSMCLGLLRRVEGAARLRSVPFALAAPNSGNHVSTIEAACFDPAHPRASWFDLRCQGGPKPLVSGPRAG